MTMKRRLDALETRCPGGMSLSARAWLGHDLTPDEREQARREASEQFTSTTSSLSKEAQEWLAA